MQRLDDDGYFDGEGVGAVCCVSFCSLFWWVCLFFLLQSSLFGLLILFFVFVLPLRDREKSGVAWRNGWVGGGMMD